MPQTLDDESLSIALGERFKQDWQNHLTENQLHDAVKLYRFCIDRSLATKCNQLLPTIFRKIEGIEIRSGITLQKVEEIDRKLDDPNRIERFAEIINTHGFPKTIEDLKAACKKQIQNEISIGVGAKYIPLLYISRNAQQPIIDFINKRPGDTISIVQNATSYIVEEMRLNRFKINEINFKSDTDPNSIFAEQKITLRKKLTNNIELLNSILSLFQSFQNLLKRENLEVAEIRAMIAQIESHTACIGEIQSFIANIKRNLMGCLVIIDAAGRGKTNLMCALANKQVDLQPTLLITAGSLHLDDKFDLSKYIQKSLGISDVNPDTFLHHIAKLASTANQEVLIIIDAINENRDVELLKVALNLILAKYNDLGFKFIVTCRDIYWDGFISKKGDFWSQYVFELIKLGDFSDAEISLVLPRYLSHFKIQAILSSVAIEKLKHPLLLRFFCEAYHSKLQPIDLGNIDDIKLRQLFDIYWDRKLDAIKNKLHLRSYRDIESFLLLIGRKMRFKRDRWLSFSEIAQMTALKDFDSPNSFYTQILDEGIILEQTPAGLQGTNQPGATFVYDEFLEYVIAKDLMIGIGKAEDRKVKELRLKRLLRTSSRFSNIYGVATYLLPMLDAKGESYIWSLVFSRGEK